MPRAKSRKEPMVLITFHIPEQMLKELDRLVEEGRYPSRSEAIRVAIRDLLVKERLGRREALIPLLG
ncbi:MAG: CopG family transcriptional regulator [Thermoprotei archaeon]|nr:MAG: CopG family transcriptional regulator [Thermoprotei archaeon]